MINSYKESNNTKRYNINNFDICFEEVLKDIKEKIYD